MADEELRERSRRVTQRGKVRGNQPEPDYEPDPGRTADPQPALGTGDPETNGTQEANPSPPAVRPLPRARMGPPQVRTGPARPQTTPRVKPLQSDPLLDPAVRDMVEKPQEPENDDAYLDEARQLQAIRKLAPTNPTIQDLLSGRSVPNRAIFATVSEYQHLLTRPTRTTASHDDYRFAIVWLKNKLDM